VSDDVDVDTALNADDLLGGAILVGVHPNDTLKTVANTATKCALNIV
jgi:hypothetical protein